MPINEDIANAVMKTLKDVTRETQLGSWRKEGVGGLFFSSFSLFGTESQKQCFSDRCATSKTVLFGHVFLTPRRKVIFDPRAQNESFLGTRSRASPLSSFQKNSSFFALGTKLLFVSFFFSKKIFLLQASNSNRKR